MGAQVAITGNAGVGARGTSMPHAGGGAGIDMTGRNNFGLNVNAGKPSISALVSHSNHANPIKMASKVSL